MILEISMDDFRFCSSFFFSSGYVEIDNSCERCKESEIRSSVIYIFGNVKIKL